MKVMNYKNKLVELPSTHQQVMEAEVRKAFLSRNYNNTLNIMKVDTGSERKSKK